MAETMKPTVYLETSVVGYLTARPSRDLIVAAHQQITQEWWEFHRSKFDLYVSQIVQREIGTGNPQFAQERLEAVRGLLPLTATPQAVALARTLTELGALPLKAEVDALHMAIAAVNGLDYLLTWNSRHIANARTRPKIEALCRAAGYEPPTICTPEELMEE
jgi:hypothetical protein